MQILSDEQIEKLYGAIVTAELVDDRDTLLEGIDPFYRANLPVQESKGEQIRSDLGKLNRTNWPVAGKRPLETWLRAAENAAGKRVEAALFHETLEKVRSVPVGEAPAPQEKAPVPVERAPVPADTKSTGGAQGSGKAKWIVLGGVGLVAVVIAALMLPYLIFKGPGTVEVSNPPPEAGPPPSDAGAQKTLAASCESPGLPGGRELGLLVVPISGGPPSGSTTGLEKLRDRLCDDAGSLRSYLDEASNRTLRLKIGMLPWLRFPNLPGPHGPSPGTRGIAPIVMATLQDVDTGLKLSDFDLGRDGVTIVLVTDTMDETWPVEQSLREAPGPYHRRDGRIVERYLHVQGTPGAGATPLGALARAAGIALGLVVAGDAEGDWSPMGTAWRMALPPWFSAPERAQLGWITPAKGGEAKKYTLAPGETLQLPTVSASKSYLFENRAQTGTFEKSAPAAGALLWRVDGTKIELVEADGKHDLATNRGNQKDVFPDGGKSNGLPNSAVMLSSSERLPGGQMALTFKKPLVSPD